MVNGTVDVFLIILFSGVFLIFCGILITWIILFYDRYQYSIAEDAILINRGILWKRSVTIPYERIQHVSVNRGPIEILLGIYVVNIFTAGTGSFGAAYGPPGMMGQFAAEGYVPGVADGDGFKNVIMKHVKATRSGSGLGDEVAKVSAKPHPPEAVPLKKSEESEMLQELRKIRKLLEKK